MVKKRGIICVSSAGHIFIIVRHFLSHKISSQDDDDEEDENSWRQKKKVPEPKPREEKEYVVSHQKIICLSIIP